MEEHKKKKPIILVMAAGMGSRYGGLKQIDPVGDHGEIIMDFSLYDAMLAGFERAVFVIKKEMDEDFRKLVEPRVGKYMDLDYAYQTLDDIPDGYTIPEGREKPWGTAHAIYAARDVLDAPFCVVNSDDYYGPALRRRFARGCAKKHTLTKNGSNIAGAGFGREIPMPSLGEC